MKALLLSALIVTAAQAQDDRDPTRWPAALRAAPAASAAASEPERAAIRQVLIQDGRPAVVLRGRLLRVGDSLDGARIERITEQAVWLREAGQLRREPLYGGVEKRAEKGTEKGPDKNTKEKR